MKGFTNSVEHHKKETIALGLGSLFKNFTKEAVSLWRSVEPVKSFPYVITPLTMMNV